MPYIRIRLCVYVCRFIKKSESAEIFPPNFPGILWTSLHEKYGLGCVWGGGTTLYDPQTTIVFTGKFDPKVIF